MRVPHLWRSFIAPKVGYFVSIALYKSCYLSTYNPASISPQNPPSSRATNLMHNIVNPKSNRQKRSPEQNPRLHHAIPAKARRTRCLQGAKHHHRVTLHVDILAQVHAAKEVHDVIPNRRVILSLHVPKEHHNIMPRLALNMRAPKEHD